MDLLKKKILWQVTFHIVILQEYTFYKNIYSPKESMRNKDKTSKTTMS